MPKLKQRRLNEHKQEKKKKGKKSYCLFPVQNCQLPKRENKKETKN